MDHPQLLARWTRSKAEYIRDQFVRVGRRYEVTPLEDFDNGIPGGTTEYEGRTLAFQVTDNRRTYLVIVEDVTLNDES